MQRRKTGNRDSAAIATAARPATARVLLCACLLHAGSALAQFSGSVSVVSDYRYRGVSLSDGRPEPQVHLSYDSSSGWYAGAFASGVKLDGAADANLQLIGYGGYFGRLPGGAGWEAGALQSVFPHASETNYGEVYAGLSLGNLSGRLYFSPDYFGRDIRTLYAEVNLGWPLHERLQLLAHVGFLPVLSRGGGGPKPPARTDLRFAASTALGNATLQLAWSAFHQNGEAGAFYGSTKPVWVMTASYAF